MSSSQFYILDPDSASDSRLFAGGQWANDMRVRCPVCNAFTETSEPPEITIELNHLGRRGFVEYLWNSHSLPLFRADVIDIWQGAGLSGFATKPVHIAGWHNRSRKPLPDGIPAYYRLVMLAKARLSEPPPLGLPCPACGFVRYAFPSVGTYLPAGMSVDTATRDGADFLGLAGYVLVLCTRRVAEVTLEAGYNKHIAFVRSEDWCRWEPFNIRKWRPKAYREYREGFLIRRTRDL